MNRIASLFAGISLLTLGAGCCCQHLCGMHGYGGTFAPAMTPACPSGACGVVQPGVAPLVQPQGYYGTYNLETVTPVAVAPVVTRTAFVPLETLPNY